MIHGKVIVSSWYWVTRTYLN